MTFTIFHIIRDDYYAYMNSSRRSNNKIEQNRFILVNMSSDDSMRKYYRCESDGCDTIDRYMNRCHCEDFFLY